MIKKNTIPKETNPMNKQAFNVGVDAVVMLRRQLDDRIEMYESETIGKCGGCGMTIIRVNNSDQTNYRNKTRYYYPGQTSAWNIFRCKDCGTVIRGNFIET